MRIPVRLAQVYRSFIEAVDAVDNGVGQFEVPSGTSVSWALRVVRCM